jgi:hypothetical protein
MLLCMPFTCGNSGWMWPGVAWRLVSLAPDLAPNNIVSLANIPSDRTLDDLVSIPALRRFLTDSEWRFHELASDMVFPDPGLGVGGGAR